MPQSEQQKKKEQRRIYDKAYRKANATKKIEQRKAYNELNRDKLRAAGRAYHHANKYVRNLAAKLYYQNNIKRLKTKAKKYYQANKEKKIIQRRLRYLANPTKAKEYKRKRQLLLLKSPYEPINEKVVFIRDRWKCQICHRRVLKTLKHPNPMCASLDHIIPLSQGGSHTYKNVQLVHLTCNLVKHNNYLPQGEQLRMF